MTSFENLIATAMNDPSKRNISMMRTDLKYAITNGAWFCRVCGNGNDQNNSHCAQMCNTSELDDEPWMRRWINVAVTCGKSECLNDLIEQVNLAKLEYNSMYLRIVNWEGPVWETKNPKQQVEQSLHSAGIIEDPDIDGGLLG